MGAFEDLHRDRVTGSLAMFDRMIFKGHLSALYKQDGARCFVWSQGVALKDFTAYAKATTERIANNARKLVTDAGRPLDVIAELESVWVTAAGMAPLPGYVCVVAKSHVEEPYQLPGEQSLLFWEEAMRVAEAVAQTVLPEKMNYEIHGNTIRHLHMHLFPRLGGDPFEGRPIDAGRLEFSRTAAELQALADAIRRLQRT